jgi:hypothetical protein
MECFTHGQEIECPECLGVGKRNRKPVLLVQSRNYSGSSTDMGACEECGHSYSISYKIDKMERCLSWDEPSRKEKEEAVENERVEIEMRELEDYKRLHKKYGE